MIRHATENDISQLKLLWDQSFDDPLNYIDFIYNKVAKPADTLVYESGNIIASMMTLIPVNFVFHDKAVRTMYIYGAATGKRFQRRGIMTKMLKYAEDYARNLEFTLSVLVPGEKYLFDYYKARGYSADFQVRVLKIKPGMIDPALTVDNDSTLDDISPEKMFELRAVSLEHIPHVEWNAKQLGFIQGDCQLYGEHIAHYEGSHGESYAVYGMVKKQMHIKECFGTTFDARLALIKDVIQKNDPKNVTIQLPVNSKLFQYEGTIQKYGMAKPLQVNTSIKDMDPYMGLMLD